ncbi:MAG: hypothetical protein OHK005_16850 [Candidatus Methylacidiphilales bacterium]
MKSGAWVMLGVGGLALGVALLLQVWRPYYFLTDDSLRLAWPVLVESGYARQAGLDPDESQFLFGGGYRLDRDAMFTPNRHPLMAGLSRLAGTEWELAMVDAWCVVQAVLAAVGFAWMAWVLGQQTWRDGQSLAPAGSWLVGLLALSYTFNGYTLYLGASGFWYWANVAALPWMVGGLWDRNVWRGGLVLGLGAWHMAVGGYPGCTVYAGLFLALLAVVRWWNAPGERWRLAGGWAVAGGVAGVAAWPWLGPVVMALPESVRGGPIPVEAAAEKAMPVAVLIGSWFVSVLSAPLGSFETFGVKAYAYGLAACPMAWFFWCALKGERRWNGWDGWLGFLVVMTVVLITRPVWLSWILAHVPVLGSLRWPYKEVFLFLFALHVWMLRGTRMELDKAGLVVGVGLIFFLAPLVIFGPPTLNAAEADREALISGRAREWGRNLAEAVRETRGVAPVLPPWALEDVEAYVALPALPLVSHNYPAYFRIAAPSGYSATLPEEVFYREPRAANVYGVFREGDGERLRAMGWSTVTLVEDEERFRVEVMRPDGERVWLEPLPSGRKR